MAKMMHRTTITVPPVLARQASDAGRSVGLSSFNAVVVESLREFVERSRRAEFAESIAAMAADPEIAAESSAITKAFAVADADGLA